MHYITISIFTQICVKHFNTTTFHQIISSKQPNPLLSLSQFNTPLPMTYLISLAEIIFKSMVYQVDRIRKLINNVFEVNRTIVIANIKGETVITLVSYTF